MPAPLSESNSIALFDSIKSCSLFSKISPLLCSNHESNYCTKEILPPTAPTA